MRSQKIWDPCWLSQQVAIILVQCGQMVGSSALDGMKMGNVMCQQIWDPFWLSQLARVILVQCGQMVGSSVLDGMKMGSATWTTTDHAEKAQLHQRGKPL